MRLPKRLRLVFHGPDRAPAAQDATEHQPPLAPEVDFVAFAEDCRLFGRTRLDGDRLTDMLNAHDEFELVDVLVETLSGDKQVNTRRVVVNRDEVLVVLATGPRGDSGRRQRTRPHPVAIQIGPYLVRGYLHALPGADPITTARRRKPMIPLTDAWIQYQSNGTLQHERATTLVVNRELADWIQLAADEEVEFPSLPVTGPAGPLLKDFTGQILLDRGV